MQWWCDADGVRCMQWWCDDTDGAYSGDADDGAYTSDADDGAYSGNADGSVGSLTASVVLVRWTSTSHHRRNSWGH
jgi:hypothetical protein